MKKIIIIGATSGLGREIAGCYLDKGWKVGVAGRRTDRLEEIKKEYPEQIEYQAIDITHDDASDQLLLLIKKMGGADVILLSSGVGERNLELALEKELKILNTNVIGFCRIVTAAYRYFADNGGGHIAVITSVAGTKGIGVTAAYSSSKRFQSTYINSLAQLARSRQQKITFTDIKPGFVATDILNKDKKYPMLMQADYAAKIIVKAIDRRERRIVVDWRYNLLVGFMRLIPQPIWERRKVE